MKSTKINKTNKKTKNTKTKSASQSSSPDLQANSALQPSHQITSFSTSAPVPAPETVIHKSAPTVGEMIWNKVKNRTINLFGFSKKLSDHCTFVAMEPNKCFLLYTPGSAITAIEQATPEYNLEQMGKFAVLTVK